jgi:hypothetical protein
MSLRQKENLPSAPETLRVFERDWGVAFSLFWDRLEYLKLFFIITPNSLPNLCMTTVKVMERFGNRFIIKSG